MTDFLVRNVYERIYYLELLFNFSVIPVFRFLCAMFYVSIYV